MWKSLKKAMESMGGKYPYYLLMSYEEDMYDDPYPSGYMIFDAADEANALKNLSKKLVYYARRTKPEWWP